MSVRMHISHSKTGSRRAHHRALVPRYVSTPSGARRKHFADPATGMYRGKQILVVGSAEPAPKAVKAKKPAKKEEKADKPAAAAKESK